MSGGGFDIHPTLLVEQDMHHQLHKESKSVLVTRRVVQISWLGQFPQGPVAPLPTNPALHHLGRKHRDFHPTCKLPGPTSVSLSLSLRFYIEEFC